MRTIIVVIGKLLWYQVEMFPLIPINVVMGLITMEMERQIQQILVVIVLQTILKIIHVALSSRGG
jgi:hypothetical protein